MATRRQSPLSPREIERYRKLLEERRRAQVNTIERLRREAAAEAVDDETTVPVAPARDAERDAYAELSRINEALRRLIDGVFGICEDCGRPIGADRLDLLLTTTRCVECQERAEAA
jgi:DnaK suppressor protein